MFSSRNKVNNLHLQIFANVQIPERKLTQVNNVEYDVKLFQVITTIIKCTYIKLKGLKLLTTHKRNFGIADKYMTKL